MATACRLGRSSASAIQGGTAQAELGEVRCGAAEVRRSGGRPSALLRSVAPTTVAGEEGSSGEVGTAPQSSKHAKKDMAAPLGYLPFSLRAARVFISVGRR